MSESTTTTAPSRLDSWKEIADYIGRDVRTAIRWEHERGLPIHRVPGGRRGSVFAYADEIDRWLKSRPEAAEPPAAAVPADSAAVAPGPAIGGGSALTPSGAPRQRRRAVAFGLVAGCALVVAVAAVVAARHPRPAALAASRVDHLELEARALVARGEGGSVLWRYALPSRAALEFFTPGLAPWYAVADLDGNGQAEVVATVPLSTNADGSEVQDELYLFSATGGLIWQQRLQDRVTFRGGSFGPPWVAGHVAVYSVRGQARIAWSQGHHTWWPSLLLVLDGAGRRLGSFVHPGQIRSVRALEVAGRPLVLIGGVSNAFRAAFLAVLDGATVTGHGPAPADSPFECTSCVAGNPLRYFVFPPSDICLASGLPYNATRDLTVRGEGFEAYTRESNAGAPLAEMVFRFSRDFDLVEARSADSWTAHEALERAGKLDHGVASCPWYGNPPPVREWDPSGRWVDLRPVAPRSTHLAQR